MCIRDRALLDPVAFLHRQNLDAPTHDRRQFGALAGFDRTGARVGDTRLDLPALNLEMCIRDSYCAGIETCGEGDAAQESVLDKTIAALSGCEVVLCSRIGFEPWGKLEASGIVPNVKHAMEPIEDAVMAVYQGMAASGKLADPARSGKAA